MKTGIVSLCIAAVCLLFSHAVFVQTPESMLYQIWWDALNLPIGLLPYLAAVLGIAGIVTGVRGAILLDAFLRRQS